MALRYGNQEAIWQKIRLKLFPNDAHASKPAFLNLCEKAGAPNETTGYTGTWCYDSTGDDVYHDADGAADWNKINA